MLTPGHTKARLFITHGGQNSLLQAVYHAVPVLAIPLFGDQFDNVVRAETKGLGLSIKPTLITREGLHAAIQKLMRDMRYVGRRDRLRVQANLTNYAFFSPSHVHLLHLLLSLESDAPRSLFSVSSCFSRFKSSALSLSRIHRSHPVPPSQRLIQWVEHVLHSGGGAHLKPASLALPWYQRCMLDLLLLISLAVFGLVATCCRCFRTKTAMAKDWKQE